MIAWSLGLITLILLCRATPSAFAAASDVDELRRLREAGRFEALDSLAVRTLPEVEAAHGPRSAEAADILDLLVEARWQRGLGHDTETRAWAERAVAIRETSPGDSIALTTSWLNLAFVLQAAGDLDEARPCFEKSLAVRERRLGPDDRRTLSALDSYGNHLYAAANYAGAVRLYRKALAARERLLGPDHEDVAASLNRLGSGLMELGDLEEAVASLDRSLSLLERIGGPPGETMAAALATLAVAHAERQDYAAARRTAERAVDVRTRVSGPDHPRTLSARSNWVGILCDAGDYERARPLAELLLEDRLRVLGPDRIEVAYSLNLLGNIMQGLGDYPGAVDYHRRSVALRERKLSPDHPSLGVALINLAALYGATGAADSARLAGERALGIYEKALGPDHYDVGDVCFRLADIVLRQGDVTAAEPLAERALAIQEAALGEASPATGATLHQLAIIRRWEGDSPGALAAAIRAERIGRDHFRLVASSLAEREALGLADMRAALAGALDVSLSVLADDPAPDPGDVSRVWDEVVRSRALVLDEMAARHRALDLDDPATRRLWDAVREARQTAARTALQGPGESPAEFQKKLHETRDAAEAAERDLASMSAAFRVERERRAVGLSEMLKALPPGSALAAYVLFSRVDPPRKGVAAGGPDTVRTYGAFVARAGRQDVDFVALGPASRIDDLARAWGDQLTSPPPEGLAGGRAEAACRKAGALLRAAVWDPVVRKLGPAEQREDRRAGAGPAGDRQGALPERIFLVCDGSLALLPFAALPSEKGYLVEDGPLVHVLTTERDLVEAPDARPPGSGLLALGDPDFSHAGSASGGAMAMVYRSPASPCAAALRHGFESLPSSGDEVRDVAALWRQGSPDLGDVAERLGSEATEAAVRDLAPGRRVLHLATHGFFFSERCESTRRGMFRGVMGLVDAGTPAESGASKGSARTGAPADDVAPNASARAGTPGNPLLLSGVALAGADRFDQAPPGEDDGILTAEEMAVLDLRSAEWAVLSGCDTGVGPVKGGEGVFGLRRALRTAGVGTVIMTLWAVEDEPARRWIRSLYRARFVDGMSTPEAVRHACRTALLERRQKGLDGHPFHWAAFTAAGEWK